MTLRNARVRAVGLAFSLISAASAATPDPTYQSLRQAPVAEAFVAENIELRRDVGTLRLKSGTVRLTSHIKGRDTVAVFSGEVEITLTPASPMEKAYLKSLTGQE